MFYKIMLFIIALVFIESSAYAGSYQVRLKNGNSFSVNSYKIVNKKIYLKYPVGEAGFPVQDVLSITGDEGAVDFLQSRGESGKKVAVTKVSSGGVKKAVPAVVTPKKKKGLMLAGLKEKLKQEKLNRSAMSGKGRLMTGKLAGGKKADESRYVNEYLAADARKREEINKNGDESLSDLPGDGTLVEEE